MTDRELMQQALEALERAVDALQDEKRYVRAAGASRAITALRAALAEQPAEPQEPVAWCHLQYNEDGTYFADCVQHYPDSYGNTPLYTAPQPARREPLTEAQICSTLATAFPDDAGPDGSWQLAQYELDIFRLAERAHGIGEQE